MGYKCYRVATPFLAALMLMAWTVRVQAVSDEALQRGIPSLAPMLETVTPAVVSIRVARSLPTASRFYFDGEEFDGEEIPDELRRYFERFPDSTRRLPRRQPFAAGAGSGVIVDAEQGYVITNHHVIDNAVNITVQLADGRALEAELLGSDAGTDVALLRIEAADLADIEFAAIDTVMVGDYVVAIGNPFGIGQTVTSGIVSALGRTGLNNDNYEDFIQTDAAINVGNSGGALVDLEGRLIGINTAIISGNGGSNGVGFAVPVDMVAAVMEHLERDGEVRRGLLGVNIVDATADVVAALDVDIDAGAVVTNVLPDSAAEGAGIQISDIIVEVDGRSVDSGRELRNIVGLMRQGQEVELRLYRDGEAVTVAARIGGHEGQAASSGRGPALSGDYRGAQLRSDNASVEPGVEVVNVDRQSPAWAAGLRPGDVIVEVNRRAVSDLTGFNAAVGNNRVTALTVLREGRRMLLFIR